MDCSSTNSSCTGKLVPGTIRIEYAILSQPSDRQGVNSGAITWHSKQQGLTCLSSTESELVAVDSALRELRYLHELLNELGHCTKLKPTVVGQDNLSTIALCEAKHFNTRTRHLSLRYHHVGDQQRLGTIKLEYLPTNNMTADVLTKPLYRQAHNRHTLVLLGHKPLQWDGIATN